MIEQLVTRRRQPQAPARPFEQRDAKLGLQRLDLAAQRGLRQFQRTRGGGQGPFLGRHQEGAGPVPIEGDTAPIHANTHISSANPVNSLHLRRALDTFSHHSH